MTANEAYQQYIDNPTSENYEELGKALIPWIEAIVAKVFGERVHSLQDAVGDALYNVLAKLTSFDSNKNSFHMWVYATTYNACIDELRHHSDRKEIRLVDIDGTTEPVDRLFLKSLIAQLSERERELVELKMDGVPNEDIAQELGFATQTVKNKWGLLQQKLRTQVGGG